MLQSVISEPWNSLCGWSFEGKCSDRSTSGTAQQCISTGSCKCARPEDSQTVELSIHCVCEIVECISGITA